METPKEWLRSNPNRTMNDYYTHLRKKGIVNSPLVSVSTYDPNNRSIQFNIPVYQSMIVGLIFSTLGIVGYFTPWFSLPILNLSVSGNELFQIKPFFSENTQTDNFSYLKYSVAIPITYAAIIFGSLMKSYFLCILSGILNLVIVGLILGILFYQYPGLFKMSSYGIYLDILSFLGIFYFLLNLKFSK